MNSVELLYDCKNTLGEGITYSSINNNLYWLDINNVSKLLIHNKFYQDIDVKEDLVSVYKALKEKVYSLNNLQKKLYTLLYSKQKEFLD